VPEQTVYLEAPDRTQELLNIKWTLRSAGYIIASTWHENGASTSPLACKDRWNARGVEQLQVCDSLVVICGKSGNATVELSMMAGFALARGLRVIWIGAPIRGLCDFRAVQQFKTVGDFQNQILRQMYSHPILTQERAAA
jgi:hypothetical protein